MQTNFHNKLTHITDFVCTLCCSYETISFKYNDSMLKYLWNVNNVVLCIANTHMVSQHYTCLFYMLYMYTVFLQLTLCRCVHSEVVCTQLVAAEVTCLGVKQTFSGQHSSMCWKSSSTPHHPSKGSRVLQS